MKSQATPETPPALPVHEWMAVVAILLLMGLLVGMVFLRGEYALIDPPHYLVEQEIEITIEGAVAHPGTYHLPRGSTLQEALKQAEPLPDSDLKRMKLQRKIRKGDHVSVPHKVMDKGRSGRGGLRGEVDSGQK